MAHGYVKEHLQKVTAKTQETAEEYRFQQLARIDKMIFGCMQAAATGSVFDIDRVIKLQQEQRRLIPGLEIAQKLAVGAGGWMGTAIHRAATQSRSCRHRQRWKCRRMVSPLKRGGLPPR